MGETGERNERRRNRAAESPRVRHRSVPIIIHHSCFINRRGFTLIELLVVIALVALLLAILIPVTRAARERGQRAVCLTHLGN